MDKREFGYDGFSDKITIHGRSHLSLLRESYQKNDLKRKITVVVSVTTDFYPFCFFAKSCRERTIYLHALLSSSSLCQIFVLSKLFASSSSTLILLFLHLPLTSCFFYIFHSHLSTYIKSSFYQTKNRIIHSYLLYFVLQWILGWILGFLLLYIYPF